jgi:hypothetical protein
MTRFSATDGHVHEQFWDTSMSEIREKLKTLVRQRVRIRGTLAKFAEWIRNHRDVGRACIADPEMNGEIVAHHVWVTDAPHWLQHKGDVGHQVEFEAVVKVYTDRGGETNYCLGSADMLQVLHTPVALTIPDPPQENAPEPVEDSPEL